MLARIGDGDGGGDRTRMGYAWRVWSYDAFIKLAEVGGRIALNLLPPWTMHHILTST